MLYMVLSKPHVVGSVGGSPLSYNLDCDRGCWPGPFLNNNNNKFTHSNASWGQGIRVGYLHWVVPSLACGHGKTRNSYPSRKESQVGARPSADLRRCRGRETHLELVRL